MDTIAVEEGPLYKRLEQIGLWTYPLSLPEQGGIVYRWFIQRPDCVRFDIALYKERENAMIDCILWLLAYYKGSEPKAGK